MSEKQEEHNHVVKMLQMYRDGEIPTKRGFVTNVHVGHDDRCQVFDGGFCNCDPSVTWTIKEPWEVN